MTISDIFQKKGEKFFRNFEEKITLKLLKKIKQFFFRWWSIYKS